MKLTPYGKSIWLPALLIAVCLIAAVCAVSRIFPHILTGSGAFAISFLTVCIFLILAALFRDPVRQIPAEPELILSPSDGNVSDIELVKNESLNTPELREMFHGQDVLRIGIRLFVFNVRICRMPAAAEILFKSCKKDTLRETGDGTASVREAETVMLGCKSGAGDVAFPVAVRHFSGSAAKRIVCEATEGASYSKGEPYGLINTGSRTEIYLPCKGFEVTVKVGGNVFAGVTPLARLLPDAKEKLQQH